MKIKNRLALNFSLITAGVLLVILIVIYFVFYSFVRNDFYSRLNDRAKVAAQVYLEADEISTDSLDHVRERYLDKLPNELIGIYDERNQSFLAHKNQYWTNRIISNVRKKKHIRFKEGGRQAVGIYYNDNQGKFVILVSASDTHNNNLLTDMAEIMFITFIVVNGMIFFVGRWFAQRSLTPIDGLITQMRLISVNDLHLRVKEGKGKDEITELARNFNWLLAHLQNAFELQQAFVTNASHELRTPVTSIMGEIEIALNKERSPEAYQTLLNSILIDTERLNNTITGLLELAQSDMEYTRAKMSPVMLDELIWELHDYWNRQKGAGKLMVEMEHMPNDSNGLAILANKSLLTIAFNNLIGNAFKFSNNQPVTCIFNADTDLISITIKDLGIGIPKEDHDQIFTSFYRSPKGRQFNGSGIGLYVTQKIVQLFNGSISVSSTVIGAEFILKFKPAQF